MSASASVKDDTALVSLSTWTPTPTAPSCWTCAVATSSATRHGADGAHLGAHNTPDQPDAVAPAPHAGVRAHPKGLEVDVPAHSYVTVALELG